MTTTKSTTARAADAGLSTRAMWAILALVLLADIIDNIDATVTIIAAPTIAQDLNGGEGLIKWVGTAYMLSMGVLLVVGGRLGDKFGQRRLFLIGMTGFALASLLAGLAPGPTLMILGRILQGAFGALLIPQGLAIMTKAFPPDMLGKAFGVFGPILAVAALFGPVVAGFVISADLFGLSWRPIFLINPILGAAGVAIGLRILPRDEGDRSTVIDGWGSGLLAAAMFSLLFGLIEGSTNGWTAIPIIGVIVGLAAFAAFAYRQRTATDPLIKPSLLRNRGFTSGLVVGLAIFAVVSGLSYVLSLFLQEGLHVTARGTALTLLPMSVGLMASVGAVMGGLLVKLGRNLIFIGLGVLLIGGLWVFALINAFGATVSVWALVPALFVIGLGMGFCVSTIFQVMLGDISAEEAGSASGSISSIQQLASAIGAAVVTSVFFYAATTGIDHAIKISLIVVLCVIAVSIPLVALMPPKAPPEPEAEAGGQVVEASGAEAATA